MAKVKNVLSTRETWTVQDKSLLIPGGDCLSGHVQNQAGRPTSRSANDSWNRSGIGWLGSQRRPTMARKSRLTRVAVKIGTAMGNADRKVQKVAKAGKLARKELDDIAKQVDALKRQLQKTAKRLKHALS
jgi:hypothetical protein